MKHRDVSTGFYGLVAGVVLSAAAIAYQNGALAATAVALVPQNLRPAAWDVMKARKVLEKGIPQRSNDVTKRYPTVTDSAAASASSAAADDSPCAEVRASLSKVLAVYTANTPINLSNTAYRQRMDAAFADALDDHCIATAASSSSSVSSAASAAAIDNHCEKYPTYTARYTQCVIYNTLGKKYP